MEERNDSNAELSLAKIKEIVLTMTGPFHLNAVAKEMPNISWTPKKRSQFRSTIHRLTKPPHEIIVSVDGKPDGWYRKVDLDAPEINWQEADKSAVVNLNLPFDLHKYAVIRPGGVTIVAGVKSGGKTAFVVNVVMLNPHLWHLMDIYDCQRSDVVILGRFESYCEVFNIEPIPKPAPFKIMRRIRNFADVIKGDRISIIDFLRLPPERSFDAENELKAIVEKLTAGGIAIVAMQKPPGRDLAYGGPFTAFDAQLYLSLDYHKLKVVYAKEPADPKVHPDNMLFTFSDIYKGVEFRNTQRSWGYD